MTDTILDGYDGTSGNNERFSRQMARQTGKTNVIIWRRVTQGGQLTCGHPPVVDLAKRPRLLFTPHLLMTVTLTV